MSGQQQIFQTATSKRWRYFKGSGRIVLFAFLLFIPFLLYSLFQNKTILPTLFTDKKTKAPTCHVENVSDLTPKDNQKYLGINHYLQTNSNKNTDSLNQTIRAAFYVNWDPTALQDLQTNINKLNMVLPEWFSLHPTSDELIIDIDTTALAIMQKANIKILPILNNVIANSETDTWNAIQLHRLLSNANKRLHLISSIKKQLVAYNFAGINIDFENYDQATIPYLISFQKELYDTLHACNKIVSQDIAPINECTEAKQLAAYNDLIFLMAYNQHYSGSNAGDICEQRWIEKVLDEALQEIPNNKLILCLAGYGYDWKEGAEATPLKYTEALSIANNYKATIDFDNDTYNSHLEYMDADSNYHKAYFVDASATFNTMRLADQMQTAGTALWRLGSEDERIWKFYNRNLSNTSLQKNPFDFNTLQIVNSVPSIPTYTGKGEVLDVQSYPQNGIIKLEIDTAEQLISEQQYQKYPTQYVIKKWGTVHNQVILTFDDGPDPNYTPRILDILEKEKVPATFFITGANAQENLPIIKRIFVDSFEIGNHTYSHPNISKVSEPRALLELKSTRLLIEAITGRSTVLFRAPYNADSEPTTIAEIIPIALSKKANYYTIGESIDSRDWEENISADSIYQRVVQQYEADSTKGIILMHDAGGNREATIAALPNIIHYFKNKGVQITTVANLLGKTSAEIMPLVHGKIVTVNFVFAEIIYCFKKIISAVFAFALFLGLLRIISILGLALLQRLKHKKEKRILASNKNQPAVSIIVPAYNESVTVISTISNLLKTTYSNYEIIFVDDGSKDDTYEKVHQHFGTNKLIKIFSKQNGGKATALNFGIANCTNNYVVCIDADTILLPNAIAHLMRYFLNDNIAAVAGNVKVGNKKNMLTHWQSIEYITSQNIDRLAFDYINGICIVPGAIGAFQKKAILQAGGFAVDTLAEDCDLTMRILMQGYTVRNCNTAIAMTEAPETIKPLLNQRLRWNYGVMQSFWKNKKACFNPKFKGLGLFGLPNILFFQIIFPLLSPIADVLFIVSLFWQNSSVMSNSNLVSSYMWLLLLDILFAGIAFYFEKEPIKNLWYVIPQRILYKPLMYIVIIKSVLRAIKGETQEWGNLQRTGNVANNMQNNMALHRE